MNLGAIIEKIDFRKSIPDWKLPDFQDDSWSKPRKLEPVITAEIFKRFGILDRYMIRERPIPLLYEETRILDAFDGQEQFRVEAGESAEFVIDVGEVLNAYPAYSFEGGSGADIKITW